MADLSTEAKCKLAVALVEQSPPGEVNDVINDIRAIINDDETLMPLIRPSLRAYNLAQLAVIEHPAEGDLHAHTSILSEASIAIGGEDAERFVDYTGKRSFAFDHIHVPYLLPEEEESFRNELASSLTKYTKNHFPTGISAVSCSQYPLLPPAPPKPTAPLAPATTATAEPSESAGAAGDQKDAGKETTDVEPTDMESAVEDVKKQTAEGDLPQDEEPEPTPAGEEGKEPEKGEETVAEPGGVEKLDEELEEAKEEEEGGKAQEGGAEESTAPPAADEGAEPIASDQVAETGVEETEENNKEGETEGATTTAAADEALPERKQERVENPTYTLEVVGNRYKTSNFWTGRWRTRWVVDREKGSVEGLIKVDVHYFEQGNVQLATEHTASFPCPTEVSSGQSIASQIVTTISKVEAAYHMELNDAYENLGEKAFRSLRRALPVTRQKMDWEKVSGYSLGADLSKARS